MGTQRPSVLVSKLSRHVVQNNLGNNLGNKHEAIRHIKPSVRGFFPNSVAGKIPQRWKREKKKKKKKRERKKTKKGEQEHFTVV